MPSMLFSDTYESCKYGIIWNLWMQCNKWMKLVNYKFAIAIFMFVRVGTNNKVYEIIWNEFVTVMNYIHPFVSLDIRLDMYEMDFHSQKESNWNGENM